MPNVYDMAPRCIYFMKPELINLKIDFVLNFNYVVLANILKRIRGLFINYVYKQGGGEMAKCQR